ncbi:MAG: hypothetical protein Q7T82_06220, partial [Armatimonadota bacterium]|nr:hypothetical protein [Armatimonadota bacterium]
RNEYCITWQNGYVIHWRRLDSTGANIGSEMVLSDNSSGHHFSVVCYNSVQHEYLIEYVVWMADDSAQVRVLRVDAATGNQIGSPIWLYSTGGVSTTGGIRVAYSPTSNSYLATYEAYSEGGIVYGQILNSTGNPVGSNFRISTTSQLYSRNPAIAWNSASNEYMVTYQGYITAPSWDYWGQRIRASDGALLGSNLAITTTHDIGGGGVAYDPVMNRYLVVYEAGGDSPWGQFVSSTPTLIGSRFAIGGGDFVGWGPSVCWDSSKKEFLVTWSASLSGSNFGRRISETGSCIGETFRNNGNWIGIGNWPPAPVYNSVNDEFLIHWYNSYAYVLVRRYKTYAPPPMPVVNFAAASGDGQVSLTWTNPTVGPFTGTMIRYSTTGYPISPTDGTLVVDKAGSAGANDSYIHTGRTNGVTYYYTAFGHDATPMYSSPNYAYAIPTAFICFSDAFSYADGNLNGNGGWAGSAGANIAIVGQTVKIIGGATLQDAVRLVSCGDGGTGYINVDIKVQAGVGVDYMWDLWIDDATGLNLARWYGAGTTARGRIGATTSVTATMNLTGGWDDLKVKINPYNNTTEFFFNGSSIGVLDHGQTGAGNYVGKLRFTRGTSTAANGNYLFFDNLVIGDVDTTPPAPITNFVATRGDTQNILSWTNPSTDDFTGTMIRYSTTGFPISQTDGTLVIDKAGTPGAGDNYTHTGLTNGTTYYYSAFTHDGIPNYSSAVNASATPTSGAATLNNSTFDADANGWTLSVWRASTAYGYGTMDWTNGVGNPGGGIRCIGTGASDNTDRCTREGGEMTKTISTVGYQNVQVSYDLRVNTLGANNTGAGSGSCGVDHNLIDEQITAYYSTNGGSSWTEAEYLLRSSLLASYQTYGTRTVDLTGVPAVNNNASFALKFRWQVNSGSDIADLDNIVVTAIAQGDITPPGPVTGFTATGGDTQNSLSWTNPTDPDFTGTKIMFKTTGYPTGPADGTQCYNGVGTSYNHIGLTNGATYYYAAYAYDEVPNYSTAAQSSVTPADVTAPGNVTSFTATSGDTQNSLSWVNPGDVDFAGVKIMFKTTGYPTGPTD